ncbi:MAG: heme-binding protein [Deltaproteobacteria bacterium]|nr:heme-binding protein [Deltaproteobacteria bacterium]
MLSGCSLVGIRSGYEQPAYEVADRVEPGVEIRCYGPRLAAETTVEAADAEAGRSAAFRLLAAYIFGANRAKGEVAMTAPVEVQSGSRKIAMTSPVEAASAGRGRHTMRFFLPAQVTLATAPEPTDPRVRLLQVPEQTLAALRFSGSRAEERVGEEKLALLVALERSPWKPTAEPVSLFYDPPWTLPFLRRNEVAVPVVRR